MEINDTVVVAAAVSCAGFVMGSLKYYSSRLRKMEEMVIPAMQTKINELTEGISTLKAALMIYETCPSLTCPWSQSEHREELRKLVRLQVPP